MYSSLPQLRRHKAFASLIKTHGAPAPRKRTSVFEALCRSIIHQQVSGKAAESIMRKFVGLFPGRHFPTPGAVLAMPVAMLRSAGLSGQKASYILNLAQKLSDGTLAPRHIPRMTNEEVIEHLVAIKGVGVWTAHMFLIFTLERPDILPVGDLGIRKGFQIVYGLKSLPTPAQMEKLAAPWREHASLASWYLWRAADGAPAAKKYRPARKASTRKPSRA